MPTKDEVVEALRAVEDPELGMDIVDLGLLYDVEVDGSKVKVIHSLTSMGCPAGPMIQENIHDVAAALRCLGGEMQAQLWPTTRNEIERATEHGIEDIERIWSIDDLAPTEVIVAATGVSGGDLLRGVRYLADSARTHSLVMCTRCNWVRFVDGIHFFARERREEVRLL